MVGEHPTQTTLPGDDLKPAWRVACVAYRKVRQSGQLDHPAWLAARAAIQELRADLDEDTAGRQASAAIHYASVFHTKWLWHRVGGTINAAPSAQTVGPSPPTSPGSTQAPWP